MVIFETSFFTKVISSLMPDDEYRLLQNYLAKSPKIGELIQGSGGLRKVRWKSEGKGKRGGIRIIYYWVTKQDRIFMLYAYAKNEREDLSKDQLSSLKKIVELEFKQ